MRPLIRTSPGLPDTPPPPRCRPATPCRLPVADHPRASPSAVGLRPFLCAFPPVLVPVTDRPGPLIQTFRTSARLNADRPGPLPRAPRPIRIPQTLAALVSRNVLLRLQDHPRTTRSRLVRRAVDVHLGSFARRSHGAQVHPRRQTSARQQGEYAISVAVSSASAQVLPADLLP